MAARVTHEPPSTIKDFVLKSKVSPQKRNAEKSTKNRRNKLNERIKRPCDQDTMEVDDNNSSSCQDALEVDGDTTEIDFSI